MKNYSFKKPLKKDIPSIKKTELSRNDSSKDNFLAIYFNGNSKDQLVGYCRMGNYNDGKTLAIEEIFIEGEHDTRALRHQLLRHITDKTKLPHVYAVCDKNRKEDFLSFGFTELKKVPEVLCARDDKNKIFIIYKITKKSADESFGSIPDLIIVDGGKGQLASALKAIQASGLEIPVISLAKQEEEIFMLDSDHHDGTAKVFSKSFARRHTQRDMTSEYDGRGLEKMLLQSRSIYLPRNSQALYLVQRIRDESHRFANELRKKLGTKKMTESDIDGIPGIGQILKRRLLKEYGSINSIRKAPLEQLEKTVGTHVAKMLKQRLGN